MLVLPCLFFSDQVIPEKGQLENILRLWTLLSSQEMWINCAATACNYTEISHGYCSHLSDCLLTEPGLWRWLCLVGLSATLSLSHQPLCLRPPVRLPFHLLQFEQGGVKNDETHYPVSLPSTRVAFVREALTQSYSLGLQICCFRRLPSRVNKSTESVSVRNWDTHTRTHTIWSQEEFMSIKENLE